MNTAASNLLAQAQELKINALALLSEPNVLAEDIDKAEKMLADSANLSARAVRVDEIMDTIKSGQSPQPGHPAFQPLAQTPTSTLPATPEDWGRKFGQFLVKVRTAIKSGNVPEGLEYFTSEATSKDGKALASNSGSTGGFLISPEFRPMLMDYVIDHSIVRQRAMVIPMSSRQLEVPALRQDGTTAGQPHWFGGMVAFWEAEAVALQETQPAFRNIVLTAHELTAVTHTSNILLQDSAVSLSALLTGPRGFPGVIGWYEDYAFLNGSGVGMPLGVLNSPATIGVSRTTSGTITYTDLVNIINKALPGQNLVWVANVGIRATLALINGPAGNPSYLWGDMTHGSPDTLLGYPIIYTEKVSPLGTRGDIGLYDFSHYYVGDRQATTIDTSTEAKWLFNQTSWKVTHRVDGTPWLNNFFTLADGVTTLSPFVVLNT